MNIGYCRALLLLFATVSALPQTSSSGLTLEDCVRLALSAPSSVAVSRNDVEIARAGIVQARSQFLPQAFISNGFTYNSPLLTDRSHFSFIALNGIREYTSLFTAAEQIDVSGRLRAALERAKADRQAALANLGITTRDLRRAVAAAYYQLLLARHLVAANRLSLEEAQNFEARTRLLADAGEVAQVDVIRAAAQVATLTQSQRAAELNAEIANHNLASFWTADVGTPLAIVDVLNTPAPPPAEAQAPGSQPFLKRPEFLLYEAQRKSFLAGARETRAQLFPQLATVFEYGLDSTRIAADNRGYATFVNLTIPVFDWFRTRSAARQFQLQATQVETTVGQATRRFSKEYEDALAAVRNIYGQISSASSAVKLSEENLRLSRMRYEGGEGLAIEVIDAQTALTQARGNYFAALAAYLNARADLEVASGR